MMTARAGWNVNWRPEARTAAWDANQSTKGRASRAAKRVSRRRRTRVAWAINALAGLALAAGCARTPPSAFPETRFELDSSLRVDNPLIRVLVAESEPEITVIPSTEWTAESLEGAASLPLPANSETTIVLRAGRVVGRNQAGELEGAALGLTSLSPNGGARIRTAPSRPGAKPAINGAPYEGRLEVFPGKDGGLDLIVVLPMEEYLRGVVPSEIGSDSPLEAMCAQAVAARSEAFVALTTRKYAGDHHDICAHVLCQVFSGAARRSERTDEAVRRTRGHVLLFQGRPISAYYASNCGGHAEDIRNVWFDRVEERAYWDVAGFDGEAESSLDLTKEADFRAWLGQKPSVYCNPQQYTLPGWTHKNFRWEREESAEDVTRWVGRRKDVGRVTAIRPVRRGVSGRLVEIEFVGERGTLTVGPEFEIRQVFTPRMRSAAFAVDALGPAERPERFLFRGAGSGHGVGMCQTGAIGMANAGRNGQEILNHYYPRARVQKLY